MRHPAAWELAGASGPTEEKRCTFADREFQRLEVLWRELPAMPKVDLLLEKHRKAAQDQKAACRDLAGLPEGWQGFYQEQRQEPHANRGVVVRAARGFDAPEGQAKVLAEATLVWPDGRQADLERRILEGIAPAPQGATRLWRAMGLEVELARAFDLAQMQAPVGKVEWTFDAEGGETGVKITVARLAMPRYWLDGPLRDWLAAQAPLTAEALRQEACDVNGHRGELALRVQRPDWLWRWRRGRPYRLDVAWLCPAEERVYHITCRQHRPDAALAMPESLRVSCCRAGAPGRGAGGLP